MAAEFEIGVLAVLGKANKRLDQTEFFRTRTEFEIGTQILIGKIILIKNRGFSPNESRQE